MELLGQFVCCFITVIARLFQKGCTSIFKHSPIEYECPLPKHEALISTLSSLSVQLSTDPLPDVGLHHIRFHGQQISTVTLFREDLCGLSLAPHIVHVLTPSTNLFFFLSTYH